MNFQELTTAITDWSDTTNSRYTANIPNFINFTETAIYRGMQSGRGSTSLRCRDNLAQAELTVTAGVVDIPSDYRELKVATFDDRLLKPGSQQFLARLRAYTGAPQQHTLFIDEWSLYPTPDNDSTFDITYFADYSGTLVDDADTNRVLTALPDLYLFGALMYGEVFNKNDARYSTWKTMFLDVLNAANADYRRSELSGATMQQKSPYAEVQTRRLSQ